MQVQQIVKDSAEKVLVAFKNVDGSGSITTGLGVSYVENGASIDGIGATKYAAANVAGFIGISQKDVPINSYGLSVVWGMANSVAISAVGSSITITAGDVLIPGAVAGTFFSSVTPQAMSTLLYRFAQAATTPVALSTAGASYCKALVRAL